MDVEDSKEPATTGVNVQLVSVMFGKYRSKGPNPMKSNPMKSNRIESNEPKFRIVGESNQDRGWNSMHPRESIRQYIDCWILSVG